jgi:hypothetical protein
MFLGAIACLPISVSTTAGTKTLAIRVTNHVRIYRKNNLFTNRAAQVKLSALSINVNTIIIFSTLSISGNKHQCQFVLYGTPNRLKTTSTFPFESPVKHPPNYNLTGTGLRGSESYFNRTVPLNTAPFPEG